MITRDGPAREAPIGALLASPPVHLLDDPLEYVLADHFRQRSACQALRRYALQGAAPAAEASIIRRFLIEELPRHHADEDEDLFPLLRRRARPEDDLACKLSRLQRDHASSEAALAPLAEALRGQESGAGCLGAEACRLMQAFATNEHRHLAIENGIVMALARVRLTRVDLRALSLSMKRRRGMPDVANA